MLLFSFFFIKPEAASLAARHIWLYSIQINLFVLLNNQCVKTQILTGGTGNQSGITDTPFNPSRDTLPDLFSGRKPMADIDCRLFQSDHLDNREVELKLSFCSWIVHVCVLLSEERLQRVESKASWDRACLEEWSGCSFMFPISRHKHWRFVLPPLLAPNLNLLFWTLLDRTLTWRPLGGMTPSSSI